MREGLPENPDGLRIGLLGGSFDPPHEGHALISRRALATLGLDRVWWLPTPGNPLKPRPPADLARRLAACRRAAPGPRVKVTDIEARLGTRYTVDTLRHLRAMCPRTRFVWLMGADNLAQLHRWRRWDEIMRLVPVAAFARPGAMVAAGLSPAAQRFARARLRPEAARALALADPPAWTLLPGPTSPLSSTMIRASGAWP
ncbi:nicotinate-nucleotide adenylyltransferase [Oceanicella actignis]|uniref:Probable nicotinate-nucleotide adenylyltransferase n=1 Tax=Oceanicella actignis TaxID=1189325 RepID=A0A1M7RSY2_9RHOB|nr:nicotinate-nucleotide adenylyltransferase [Oceanicella actignis]SET05628.1 nicotinate-nucleotide adenylyltransferase [Oceanicella actignis]SHN49198.1 nicotinate-nucleotide adenylyltransferase [Oceanicella actignis]